MVRITFAAKVQTMPDREPYTANVVLEVLDGQLRVVSMEPTAEEENRLHREWMNS